MWASAGISWEPQRLKGEELLNLPIKILQTIQIETEQANIEFTGINTLVAAWDIVARVTSRHLLVIINAQTTDALERDLAIQLNGDTGANYSAQELHGSGAAAIATVFTGIGTYLSRVDISGDTVPQMFGGGVILIPHAFNTINHKALLGLGGACEDLAGTSVGRWASTAAITSIFLYPAVGNFSIGSTIHLGVIDERYLVEEWISAGVGTAIFDNIPQGEGDLVVIGYAKSTQDAIEDEVLHYINDDGVAANHPAIEMLGRGAGPPTSAAVNGEIAMIPGQQGANIFGALAVSYSQFIKDNQPHFLSLSGYHSSVGPTSEIRLMSGRRDNIEPINKIELDPRLGVNFFAGSLFSLYRVPKRIIERVELTAPQATITFDNIPQNFEAIMLHVYAKTDQAAGSDPVRFTINADVDPNNYNHQQLYGFAGAVTAVRSIADRDLLLISGSIAPNPNEFDGGTLLFPAYAENDRHKHIIGLYGNSDNSVFIQSARWLDTDPITSIAITPLGGPNFLAGTVVELEGILRKEGLPPVEGQQVG